MITTIKDMVRSRYIEPLSMFLEYKLTMEELQAAYNKSFKSDPLVYREAKEIRRYPPKISEIIHSVFLDLEDVDNEPDDPIYLSEDNLRKRCLANVNKLIFLIQ